MDRQIDRTKDRWMDEQLTKKFNVIKDWTTHISSEGGKRNGSGS